MLVIPEKFVDKCIANFEEEMTHVLMSINVVARKLGISQSDILNEISKKCNEYGWDVDWNQK